MLDCAHVLLNKEKEGSYPGGGKYRFVRCNLLGGPMLCWILRAFKARLYSQAIKLAWPAGLLILGAIIRQIIVRFKGQRPTQTLTIKANKKLRKTLAECKVTKQLVDNRSFRLRNPNASAL